MICHALATCIDGQSINWCFPKNDLNPSHLFAQKKVNQWKREITQVFNRIDINSCTSYIKDNHYLFALKSEIGLCFIACDTQLTPQQIKCLSYHLLIKKMALDEVANDLDLFSEDPQHIEEKRQQDLREIEAMKKNIEQIIEQSPKIEDLIERINHWPPISFRFKSSEQVSSCITM